MKRIITAAIARVVSFSEMSKALKELKGEYVKDPDMVYDRCIDIVEEFDADIYVTLEESDNCVCVEFLSPNGPECINVRYIQNADGTFIL